MNHCPKTQTYIVGAEQSDYSPEDRAVMQRDFERSIYEQNPPGDGAEQSSAGGIVSEVETTASRVAPRTAGPGAPCPLGDNCPDAHKYGSVHPAPDAHKTNGPVSAPLRDAFQARADAQPTPTDTPITDREVYKAQPNDVGFYVVNPSLARKLERALTQAQAELDTTKLEYEQMNDAAIKLQADLKSANARADKYAREFALKGEHLGEVLELVEAERAARESAERKMEQMSELLRMKTGDLIANGKTLIDFYHVWLDQEKTRAEATESRIATVEAALTQSQTDLAAMTGEVSRLAAALAAKEGKS